MLSYVPGAAVTPPYADWALTDQALVSVAELLRAYHHAVSTFDPTPHAWPPSPPKPFAGQLVSHHDPNLDNIVFRGGRAVALIDFDLASPGSRLWDIACAARLWAPLRPDAYIHDPRRGRSLERFRLFVDSYGVNHADRPRIVEAVQQNYKWFRDLIQGKAANGHPGFTEYWNARIKEGAEDYSRWYLENQGALRAALE